MLIRSGDNGYFCLGPIVKFKTISSLIFMYAVGTLVCLFEGTTVYQTRCICLSLIPKNYLKFSGSKHLLSAPISVGQKSGGLPLSSLLSVPHGQSQVIGQVGSYMEQ